MWITSWIWVLEFYYCRNRVSDGFKACRVGSQENWLNASNEDIVSCPIPKPVPISNLTLILNLYQLALTFASALWIVHLTPIDPNNKIPLYVIHLNAAVQALIEPIQP